MGKKDKSSNEFLNVPPPQAETFEYANTPFGKNVKQEIENPDEYAAREQGGQPV